MQCPGCQSENPADARFCNKCGGQFEIACPKCKRANPPDSNFCNGCGHPLEQNEQPVEKSEPGPSTGGERKHVTVLFSDLSGYTAMSEKLDPEEVKEIMTRVFDRIKGVIAKYDGFIEKFAGDAVMAIFGVPKAHEDDPVRAIRAAREIHDLVKFLSPEVEGLFRKVYLQMTDKDARISPVAMVKNIGFLLTNLPVVNRKVEQHFTNAIELAREVNARGILAQAYLDFGIYHQTKKRPDKARECITRAIVLFNECKAEGYLKQAEEVLGSLDDRDGQIHKSEIPEKI